MDILYKLLDILKEISEMNTGSAEYYCNRGLCCIKTDETEQAIDDMEIVLKITSSSIRRGIAQQNLNQLRQ